MGTAGSPGTDPRSTPRRATRRSSGRMPRPVLVLVAGFGASRVAARLVGVQFDGEQIANSFQYIDTVALREDLLGSLWYSHTQPPAVNLFLGIVVRLGGDHVEGLFQAIYVLAGLAMTFLLHRLCLEVGASRRTAVVLPLVIMASPQMVLFENTALYEYLLSLGMTAAVVCVGRYVATGALRWFVAFCAAAGALMLGRSLCHPIWYLLLVGLVLLARRPPSWRPAVVVAAVPFLLAAVITGKNAVLYGQPTMNSWFGMNLQHMTVDEMPRAERAALAADGTLHRTAVVDGFLQYDDYAPYAEPCVPAHPDVLVLSQPRKTGSVHHNFNYECFLPLYAAAQQDSLTVARREPGRLLATIAAGWQISFAPTSSYHLMTSNRNAMGYWANLYDGLFSATVRLPVDDDLPGIAWMPDDDGRVEFSLTALASFAVCLVLGWRGLRRVVARRPADGVTAVHLVLGVSLVLFALAGNAFEIGENMRFRFILEPAMLVVTLVPAWALVRRRYLDDRPKG